VCVCVCVSLRCRYSVVKAALNSTSLLDAGGGTTRSSTMRRQLSEGGSVLWRADVPWTRHRGLEKPAHSLMWLSQEWPMRQVRNLLALALRLPLLHQPDLYPVLRACSVVGWCRRSIACPTQDRIGMPVLGDSQYAMRRTFLVDQRLEMAGERLGTLRWPPPHYANTRRYKSTGHRGIRHEMAESSHARMAR